jgi:hypothetical protein
MSRSSKRRRRREIGKEAQKIVEKGTPQKPRRIPSASEPPMNHWMRRFFAAFVHRPAKFVWWLLGALALVIGIIAAFPKVSVDLGTSLNESDLLAMRYNLINEGLFKIYDVYCIMRWEPDPSNAEKYDLKSVSYWDTNSLTFLAPGGKHSCNFYNFDSQVDIPTNMAILIQIDVVYRPVKFLKIMFTHSFQFDAKKYQDGKFDFVPYDGLNINAFPRVKDAVIQFSNSLPPIVPDYMK